MNEFITLLEQFPQRYSCTALVCTTCGGGANRHFWITRDVDGFVRENPQSLSAALFALRPADITSFSDWKLALPPALKFAAESAEVDFGGVLRRWSGQLQDSPNFATFIIQEVFRPDYEIEVTDRLSWVLASLKVAEVTRDCDLIRSLLTVDTECWGLNPLITDLATDVALLGEDSSLILSLLSSEGVDPAVRSQVIRKARTHAAGNKQYALDLIKACQGDPDELGQVLSELVPEQSERQPDGYLVCNIADQLGPDHELHEPLLYKALQVAREEWDFELAFRVQKAASREGRTALMSNQLTVEIALQSSCPELAVELLRYGMPEPEAAAELLDSLITAAHQGDLISARGLCEVIVLGHPSYQDAHDLKLKLENELAAAETRRKESEAERLEAHRREQIDAQRRVQIKRNEVRTQILSSFSSLPNHQRLSRIALDNTHSINFYPTEWAGVTETILSSIPVDTVVRLRKKLEHAHRGPWRRMRWALAEIHKDR